ncbi:21986_t:CDS:2, partial [Gigaspora margarita]
ETDKSPDKTSAKGEVSQRKKEISIINKKKPQRIFECLNLWDEMVRKYNGTNQTLIGGKINLKINKT